MKIFIDTIGNLGNIFLCIKYGLYLCEKYNLNVNESLYVVYPHASQKLKSFQLKNIPTDCSVGMVFVVCLTFYGR